jgi:hypothetical protein
MMRYLLILLLICFCLPAQQLRAVETDIKNEYSALNEKSQQTIDMAPAEVAALLKRCSALQSRINSLQGAEKKVMSRKLRQLCGLFEYVLQAKQQSKEEL